MKDPSSVEDHIFLVGGTRAASGDHDPPERREPSSNGAKSLAAPIGGEQYCLDGEFIYFFFWRSCTFYQASKYIHFLFSRGNATAIV